MASTPEVALNSNAAAGGGGGGGKGQQMDSGYGASPARSKGFSGLDFALRFFLFATSLSGLVVLVTSKQTVSVPVALQPQLTVYVSRSAKFSHSPALIYLLVALSMATLYSFISLLISLASRSSSSSSSKLFKLLVLDLLLAGIMASAAGSAGSVAYIGLKGNSHVLWNKICNNFDKFCRHVGSSTLLAIIASILLLLLVLHSSYTLFRRSR